MDTLFCKCHRFGHGHADHLSVVQANVQDPNTFNPQAFGPYGVSRDIVLQMPKDFVRENHAGSPIKMSIISGKGKERGFSEERRHLNGLSAVPVPTVLISPNPRINNLASLLYIQSVSLASVYDRRGEQVEPNDCTVFGTGRKIANLRTFLLAEMPTATNTFL